ncbi:S9 family peptidase [Aurantibacillus circumpalustris]|uniref:S9 family peptidase n=1 Tax=Aurantibacillus circumpalustris TaxID=3036359 RepID=UPI00295B88A3|nr:S9 family peptidase [Aurantibacillus circumpalustris]
MKRIAFLFLLISSLAFSQQKITLEDIWSKGTFSSKSAQGFNVLNDGLHYADIEVNQVDHTESIFKFDLKSQKKVAQLVYGIDLKFENRFLDIKSYEFSPNEDKLLLNENMEHVYRRSPKANYFVFDIASKKITQLSEKGKQLFPTFSPDGKKIAYVIENNLYIKNLETGTETAVTTDGEKNKIKNGWGDWVYEEEFSKADYFDWSPNSQYLAYVRFDESRVKEFTMDYYKGELYPERNTFKYPKAGEDNSLVSVHIFDLLGKTKVTADIGSETDIYIPRIEFTNDPKALCIQRMNRLQNKLEFLFTDVKSGKSNVIYTDESKTYVDVTDDLRFVGNTGFIVSSERDEYNHLYYYDLNGKLINQVTNGNWDVMEFKGFNEATKTLYFLSTENGAINRDMYSVSLDGKTKKRLSPKTGQTNFEFAKGYKYYVSTYSNANTPPVYELYSIDGKLVKVLESNADLLSKMGGYNLTKKTFFRFKHPEGLELNGWMMKPTNFDSTKKYPVYMYAYGGPGGTECNNGWDWNDYFWHNLLTQEGYIVVCVDNRGTQGRGRQFKHSTYLQLGKLETIDQIEVAKYLGELSYVDKSRIGFQGWSYGGYMASLMISKGADVIKAAIAVAPVTNWKYYDNIYTERFLRQPKDNKSGYEDNSPTNFVKNIKGKFLLIHGSGDDNVHMQNSMELAAAMVKSNIPFDFMIYPNKSHGISGGYTRLHIYSKMLKFVKENL